jgi:ABC-type polysaccharide/polyol phosphate export permease
VTLSHIIPEFRRITDRYFWLTAYIIARNSVVREYQNSFLGVVWTVILPLIQVIIFAIIMPLIMAKSVVNYPLFLVASFPLWAFISGSLVQSCTSIIGQGETIKRCMVSSVIFPISDIMRQFYTYMISFLTMYVFCLFFYRAFDPVIFWFPLLLPPIIISVMSVSIAISYLAPYIRDVGYLMHMVVNIMFWFTPVVYPLQSVPEKYHWLFWFNPFFILMHPVQQLVMEHKLPDAQDMMGLAIVTSACVFFSFILYRTCRRNYVYYL